MLAEVERYLPETQQWHSPEPGGQAARQPGSQAASQPGSQAARQPGSQAARPLRGQTTKQTEGPRERGSEGARERGSEGARERGSEPARHGQLQSRTQVIQSRETPTSSAAFSFQTSCNQTSPVKLWSSEKCSVLDPGWSHVTLVLSRASRPSVSSVAAVDVTQLLPLDMTYIKCDAHSRALWSCRCTAVCAYVNPKIISRSSRAHELGRTLARENGRERRVRHKHTRHILPPSEIDLGLCWADFTDLEGKHLFHRNGWKGRIWQLW